MIKLLTLLITTLMSTRAYAGPAVIWGTPFPRVLSAGLAFKGSDAVAACDNTIPGAIRWNGSALQVCDGSSWANITTGGAGANAALSNLASVAINTSLLPGTNLAIDNGSSSKQYSSTFSQSVFTQTVSPVAAGTSLNLSTGNNASGSSGDIILTVGTASATQGAIKLLKSGVASVSGQVWTASSTDGTGYWATSSDFINGGNAFSAASTLGNTSNFALNFIANNVNYMRIDNTNGFVGVGVGTTTPTNNLHVVSSGTTGSDHGILQENNVAAVPGGQFIGRHSRGTFGSPSAISSGDVLSGMNGFGYGTSKYLTTADGVMRIIAAEAFTDTAHGTNVEIFTTPLLSASNTVNARFLNDKGFQLAAKSASNTLTQYYPAGGTSYNITWPASIAGGNRFLSSDSLGNLNWAVDANFMTNVNAVKLQTFDVSTNTPTSAQILTWNATVVAWRPEAAGGGSGTVTAVFGGTGIVGTTITGTGTITVDVGTTASKIVQLTAAAQLPAVDGFLLTNLSVSSIKGGPQYPAIDGFLITNVNAVKLQTFNVATNTPTSAQVLTFNSTTTSWRPETAGAGSATVTNMQVFTASGTFTLPASAGTGTKFKFTVVGGGGGGAGQAVATNSGGGGGAGATALYVASGQAASSTVAVTIGAAGSAGTSGNNGTAGGNSTIVFNAVTVTGGGGGAGLTTGFPGAGGTATNGTLNIRGGDGSNGDVTVTQLFGGHGGGSTMGGGTTDYGTARPYGVGGGGGSTGSGGAGAAGVVIVEWVL